MSRIDLTMGIACVILRIQVVPSSLFCSSVGKIDSRALAASTVDAWAYCSDRCLSVLLLRRKSEISSVVNNVKSGILHDMSPSSFVADALSVPSTTERSVFESQDVTVSLPC
jgi:hypothetical protein